VSRFIARYLLGGGVLNQASWEAAVSHLSTAARLDSTRIYHRLDLARVLADRRQYSLARDQLLAIRGLQDRDALDERYRQEAEELLAGIAGKEDKRN
jgi:hypothetical protein